MSEAGYALRLASAGTTQVLPDTAKVGNGRLKRLLVTNVGTTMTIDIYDHASANNNKVVEYVSADGKVDWMLDTKMQNGIRVVVGGTPGLAVLEYS